MSYCPNFSPFIGLLESSKMCWGLRVKVLKLCYRGMQLQTANFFVQVSLQKKQNLKEMSNHSLRGLIGYFTFARSIYLTSSTTIAFLLFSQCSTSPVPLLHINTPAPLQELGLFWARVALAQPSFEASSMVYFTLVIGEFFLQFSML